MKIFLGILTIIALLVGVILIFGGKVFYPEKKFQNAEAVMHHKRMKIKLIGYVVCMVAFLIALISSSL